MKLRFTPRATYDLAGIADYIHERNPNAALRVRAAILESLQDLILFPELGRHQTVEGVRKLITRKYSYLVYYSLDQSADEIVILTIQHPAREREFEDV
jgi:plasmid stabilization system protein ParE